MFLLLWFTGVPAMMAVVSVFSSNMEFSEIKRELKNGFYHPVSYLVANTVIQVPRAELDPSEPPKSNAMDPSAPAYIPLPPSVCNFTHP